MFYNIYSLIFNQAIHILHENSLITKIDSSYTNKTPLIIKVGFDPTSDTLHLGHTILFNKLSVLQKLGHLIVFIIGDFTAGIGDPSGKNKTRPQLSRKDIKLNSLNFYHQSYSFLNPKQTIVKYNSEWFNRINVKELILMCSAFSTFYILNRKDFHIRFCKNQSVFMHEILYPVLQGLDSLFIKSDIEIGGSDQLFNLITGRHIMKKHGLKSQSIMTLPLIEGINGLYKYGKILGEKMSKSLNNYIPLTSIVIKDFSTIMGMCDEIMLKFYMCIYNYPNNKLLRMKNIYIYSQFLKYNLVYTLFSVLGNIKKAQSSFADFHHFFIKKLKKINNTPKYYIKYSVDINFIRFLAEYNYLTSVNLGKKLLKSSILLINNKSYSLKNIKNKHNIVITVTKKISLWTYIY